MKKLLFVINTMGQAGAETALIRLLKSLDPEEYEISLYVLMGQGEMIGQVPSYVRVLNKHYVQESVLTKEGHRRMIRTVLKSYFSNGGLFRKVVYTLKILGQMLKQGKIAQDKLLWRVISDGAERFEDTYDLAVAYLEGGATYYVADHVKAKKSAAFVHIDYGSSGYTRQMDQDCYAGMDRIFAVSEETKELFAEFYPEWKDKVWVFRNILDPEEIREKSMLPGGFPQEEKGFKLLTVGRLTHQKAYDIALDALYLLRKQGRQVSWYILGEGPERAALEKKREELSLEDAFFLPGAVKNPYPWYRQTDLYVHATRFEGKSIAIQEAQVLGCAILASDSNGNKEQIVDGVDGILCELDAEAIQKSVLKLMDNTDLCKRLGEAAAKKQVVYKEDMEGLLGLLEV